MINYPFEGTSHEATLIMLPYRKDIWLNSGRDAIDVIYQMAEVITKYERLILLADPHIYHKAKVKFKLPNTMVLEIPYNDAWARDICPLFVIDDKKLKAVSFDFNAWGGLVDGLYSDYSLDILVKEKLVKYLNIPEIKVPFILEGGSINTNGKGVLLTTKACLLSKGRNPQFNEKQITEVLKTNLNQKEVIWLDNGIYGDETNEHVDNMAVFLDEWTIALAWAEEGVQHTYSKKAYDMLKSKGFDVIKIPVPSPDLVLTSEEASQIVCDKEAKNRLVGTKLSASYINFYQSDKYILLPQFGVKEDEVACNLLEDFYKGKKEIYQIYSRPILVSGGNIHCITMQIPEVKHEN